MKKKIVMISISLGFCVLMACWLSSMSVNTLKYFPIDPETKFTTAQTDLVLKELENQTVLSWIVESNLEKPAYLRQDVSLLFENGQLKGIQSKWIQDEQKIVQEASLALKDSQLYQTISYHYAELHGESNDIKSINKMTTNFLYIIDDTFRPAYAFKNPSTPRQEHWVETLQQMTNQQLDYHWTELINHFNIDRKQYLEIPLIELSDYAEKPLLDLDQARQNRVIAQLWEGLYQNYILPFKVAQKVEHSLMPLILVSKQSDHLIVVYEDLEGNKKQLIQRIANEGS
ncbi:hypothetical protein [Amphibacillus sediminis]|uniref:hypothetical protein n=1 Tax=Amphibacillus sediminis TaxID=360185 RepID=UPI000836E975|nr:hypothetical protein [Amphibacillus sediminis]